MRVPGIPYVQGKNSYTDTDGKKYGIAIHNTSNDAPAANEASYATRREDGVSAHFYADDEEVIQSLDTNARAGHAGSSNGNQNAIAVEITGVNGWTRTQWLNNVNWNLLGQVLHVVCAEYSIAARRATVQEMKDNPKVRAFYSHNDMRLAWGGTTHDDPGPNFPWDRLFQAVNAGMDDDMNLSDKVRGTRNPDRTVENILADLSNDRDERISANVAGIPTPPDAGSMQALVRAMAKAFPALVAEVSVIKANVMADDAPLAEVAARLAEVRVKVLELSARPAVTAKEIADAIPAGLAEGVVNALAERLKLQS